MSLMVNIALRWAMVLAVLTAVACSWAQDNIPTVEMGDITGAVGQTVVLRAHVSQAGRSVSNTRVVFRVNRRLVGITSTNSSGIAEMPYTVPASIANNDVETMASLGGSNYVKRTLKVTIPRPEFALEDTVVRPGEPTLLKAILKRPGSGDPIRDATVSFRINGVTVGFARTDASGKAQLALRVPTSLAPGIYIVEARFRGTSTLGSVTSTSNLIVQL